MGSLLDPTSQTSLVQGNHRQRSTPDVLAFNYEEASERFALLWVHEADYVVILEKREKNGRIIAYRCDGLRSRRCSEEGYAEEIRQSEA